MAVRICENGHEITDDGLFYCPTCRSVELRPVGQPRAAEADRELGPVVDVAARRRDWKRDDARDRLQKVGLWGLGLYVAGALVWVVALSEHDEVDSGGGAMVGVFLGVLTASVGAAMVLVFLIGWGVKLGREAADV